MKDIIIYFLNPLESGYTFSKTLVYSVTLFLTLLFLYKIIKSKLKIKIDENFLIFSLFLSLPFSSLRVLEDYSIIKGIIFVTPWIEFLYFVFFLITLYFVRNLKNYEKISIIIGMPLFFAFLFQLEIKNLFAIYFFVLILLITIVLLKILKLLKLDLFDRLVILSQTYEGSITTINVFVFHLYEQHIFSRFLLENFGFFYLAFKIFSAILFIIAINFAFKENKEFANYLKTSIIVLSFAIGTRNFAQSLGI
ncbi:MAG: DUF63 family protein [Candidatus Aenigmatarchaeota archaeon]